LTIAAVLAVLAACNPTQPATSNVPGPSEQAAATGCPSIELRAPSGAKVALTAPWRGNDTGLYYMRKDGSCFWWLGQSQYQDESAGTSWTNVMVGTVHPDFTITGTWGDVPFGPYPPQGHGEITVHINFDTTGTDEVTYLSLDAATGGFGATRWVLESSLPEPVELTGIFGGAADSGCAWIETADGTRYELGGPAMSDKYFRTVPISLQDYNGYILIGQGDPMRVVGQVAPLLDAGCDSSYVLASVVEAAP
jgi:hypothetical protein